MWGDSNRFGIEQLAPIPGFILSTSVTLSKLEAFLVASSSNGDNHICKFDENQMESITEIALQSIRHVTGAQSCLTQCEVLIVLSPRPGRLHWAGYGCKQ